jgi:hypothetical protein
MSKAAPEQHASGLSFDPCEDSSPGSGKPACCLKKCVCKGRCHTAKIKGQRPEKGNSNPRQTHNGESILGSHDVKIITGGRRKFPYYNHNSETQKDGKDKR